MDVSDNRRSTIPARLSLRFHLPFLFAKLVPILKKTYRKIISTYYENKALNLLLGLVTLSTLKTMVGMGFKLTSTNRQTMVIAYRQGFRFVLIFKICANFQEHHLR